MPTPQLSPDKAREAIAVLDACNGNMTNAAAKLGLSRGTLQGRIKAAALQGMKPKPASTAATSTLYGPDGQVMLQWVKDNGRKSPQDWAALAKDVYADISPVKVIAAPKQSRKDLLTVYPIGDHHVAMYAWHEETGSDYDIKIADRLLTSAAKHLVDAAPESDTAMIVNLGDFFHVDNLKNETSRSGNTLDVDTRYAEMIRSGVRMLRAVIETALTKHKTVHVVCATGNHDDVGSLWLALTLSEFYASNPRVKINSSPSKFHYHRHGKVLIGVTHGDTGKPEKLQGVMAADRASDWGATEFRYWLTGHVHNRRVIEFPGVVWETFRTLAPGDAWSHAAGYRAGRDMTAITFHDQYGEISRSRFDVAMLR